MSSTSPPPGSTRNRMVAPILAALLAAACSGSPDPRAQPAPLAAFRADGAGFEPGPGETLDVGATTVARSPAGRVRLATLSSRADLVTGGDVLVEVRAEAPATPTLAVDDRPVSGLPEPDGEGRIRHLLTGLPGVARISAAVGEDRVELTVASHPADGPLFAGPRLEPFVCRNETADLPPATDASCSAPTVVSWSYRSTDGAFHDLPDPQQVPADVVTTTVAGREVPYLVREERGVLDQGIYRVVVLDPRPGPTWDRRGWNGRLVHRFGGGCGSTYNNNAGDLFNANPYSDHLLGRGYAVVTSTLTTFQATCNPTRSAEVTARLREHFIERYGVPTFVLGEGGSGGAIQQLQIAANYPGLLDALAPWATFPDALSISPGVTDCGLLLDLRARGDMVLTDEQWAAIAGFATMQTCTLWKLLYLGGITPDDGCDPALAGAVYDPAIRPRGVRCTTMDANINTIGRDPVTGFARRPLDNVGVAYGLSALRAGTISVDEFLDLNERIGGYDADGRVVAERTEADGEAIAAAYRSGGVLHDPRALADVPVIVVHNYTDPDGDVHDSFRPFSLRQRLLDAGLPATNAVVWMEHPGTPVPEPTAVVVADEWLTRAAATPADRPWTERLAASRPEAAQDTCRLGSRVVRGDGVHERDDVCRAAMPRHGDPRTAAGAPLRNDILKCALRPVDDRAVSELGVELTAPQRERLARVFPDGLCDWAQPGQHTVAWGGPWQRY